MAICRGAVELWRQLKGRLPPKPSVLEIGQSNWYGDVNPRGVPELAGEQIPDDPFDLARVYYRAVLDYGVIDAVDMNGRTAYLYDLNLPLPMDRLYDIVIDTGTSEHVFNQRQVFETIHDRTRPGGIMTHCFPVAGCSDHGFYTYSPCFLREMQRANAYEVLAGVEVTLGSDRICYIAWQKPHGRPFANPQQRESRGVMGGVFK